MRFTRQELRTFTPAAWLFIRLILGIEWVRGAWEKIGDSGWTASPTGAAVEGFLNGAIAKSTQGPHPEVPHWWHDLIDRVFLPNTEALAYLVAYGELLVGVALIAGVLTRPAALAGVAMNLAFLGSGTSSTNPPFVVHGLAIVFLGSGAGKYGADGWLGPWLWKRAGRRGRDIASVALLVLGAVTVGWLAWIIVDLWVWLLAAVLAVVAALIGRLLRATSRSSPTTPAG